MHSHAMEIFGMPSRTSVIGETATCAVNTIWPNLLTGNSRTNYRVQTSIVMRAAQSIYGTIHI